MVIYGEYIHMIMVNLVYTLFLAGKSPNIWSYTVNIYIYIYAYDYGQPCTYVISGREITKYMVIYGEYIYDHGQPCIYVISGREITKYMVIYGEYIYDYGQL